MVDTQSSKQADTSDTFSNAEALLRQLRTLAMPSPKEATLTVLAALLSTDNQRADDLLAELDDAAWVERGRRVGSDTLLQQLPSFLYSAVRGVQAMSEAALAELLIDPAVFGVLAAEGRQLAEMLAQWQSQRSEETARGLADDTEAGQTRRRLMGLRDTAAAQLVAVLPKARRPEVVKARGNADTDTSLVLGARAVATMLEALLGAGGEAARRLQRRRVTPTLVTALRDTAARFEVLSEATARSPRRVDQRALDTQDGRVVALMESVVSAWRGVMRAGHPVTMPDVGELAWLLGLGAPRPAEPEVAPKPAPGPDAGA